ncbi:MAG: PIG-L family deacetylase [Pseudomonadota bacterium]
MLSAGGANAQDGEPRPTAPARPAPPSILAILAHPDDEITIAPVLARVARMGGTVTLIYATSGDAGPGTSGLDSAPDIAEMRQKEGRCAAFALGLDEPIFWDLGDGQLATMARAPDSAAKQALGLIEEALQETQPDVVMTWGPDGGYGHADHRTISALVTQVMARRGPGRPDLLYAALPHDAQGTIPGFESWATTSSDLLTDRIRYQPQDLEATQSALDCYISQFPVPARQGLLSLLHSQVWRGSIHFRMAFPDAR